MTLAAASAIAMPAASASEWNDRYAGPSNSESAKYSGNPLPWWWSKQDRPAPERPSRPRTKDQAVKR
jgi:hypothetical protein